MSNNVQSKLVVAGFAIFAMVFGSSNIVFPLIVGKNYANHWFIASIGWLFTAVLIHFIGDYSAILYNADNKKFMKPLGKYFTFAIMFCIMMLVGPFGGIARNVNVSYDCIKAAFPSVDVDVFRITYCIALVMLAWSPGKLVDLIGRVFTPLKFGGILGIALLALYFKDPNMPAVSVNKSASEAFLTSLNLGYQTMDMLTAFMGMGVIYGYIKNALPVEQQNNDEVLRKSSVKSFFVAGTIISIVYIGLIYLGAQYSPVLGNTPDAALLPEIARMSLGPSSAWFVAIVIAVSCLATNIALTSIFTDYLYNDIFLKKVNQKVLLLVTGAITYVMSLLGFGKLCEVLGKVLGVLYPFLIVFVIVRIIQYHCNKK
ncbi:MAG: branched-chain amino acid transport system II carrier protein [Alphaproteobacteria bacterium]|nr:branched-chain amino acid transport system II carrier protein [Alphaproteobacteria bacterium]